MAGRNVTATLPGTAGFKESLNEPAYWARHAVDSQTLGLAGLFVAVNAVPAGATPPGHFGSALLARGTLANHGRVAVRTGMDVVVVINTVEPGGSSGWHSHPGGALVVVVKGEITTYQAGGEGESEDGDGGRSKCIITKYSAGQAFVESPGAVLLAVNNGSTQVISYATFPGVPKGVVGAQRTDEPNPGTCPGV